MTSAIALPMWLVIILAVAALASVWQNLLRPLLAIYIRDRERRLTQKLSTELSRKLPEVLNIGRKTRVELFTNKPEVRQAVTQAVHENQGTREVLEHKVHEYAEELTPGFNALLYFRVGYGWARGYIKLLYDVHVARQPPPAIDEIPENASIVLVGNHRSNVDVMLLAFLAARTNMISFAAGEWARSWPLSWMVRVFGSYMIRRNEALPLYRRILAIHLQDLVRVQMPQGIFLEGGLTRDGAIQPLKLGLMSYILGAIGQENVHDIVFVPVAFNYDQVPEDRTLIKHQQRGFQNRSSLYTLYSTVSNLVGTAIQRIRYQRGAYGRAEISFGEPLSINAWLEQQDLLASDLGDAQKKDIVQPVADLLIGRIKDMIPVLPISIVSTVFVRSTQTAISESEILVQAQDIYQEFLRKDSVMSFDLSDSAQGYRDALELLTRRNVLTIRKGMYQPNPANQSLLYYLYNSTRHLLENGPAPETALQEPHQAGRHVEQRSPQS